MNIRYVWDGDRNRLAVVYAEGRKLVSVLYTGTLRHERVPKEQIIDVSELMPPVKPRHLAKTMRERRRVFDRCGTSYSKPHVARVLKMLETNQ